LFSSLVRCLTNRSRVWVSEASSLSATVFTRVSGSMSFDRNTARARASLRSVFFTDLRITWNCRGLTTTTRPTQEITSARNQAELPVASTAISSSPSRPRQNRSRSARHSWWVAKVSEPSQSRRQTVKEF